MWAAMKASFPLMSSPPTVRKSRGLAQNLHLLLQTFVVLVQPRQFARLGLLPLDRRGRARSLQLKPPCLQLRRRHPKLSRNTRLRRPRRQKARNRLLLVLRRKPPPRLPRHHIPPDRSVFYRPVRDPGATSSIFPRS